ncbi:MAG: transcriptional regulator, AbrB family [Firmicutes bacterium]|nr:transcriptional regulator, AbrB family [Bacillota bacterium]
MTVAKVSEKGQLTLPAEIRKKLNIVKGTYMRISIDGEEIRLIPETKSLSSLRGIVKVKGEQDFNEIREHVMGEVARERIGKN